MVWFLFTNSSGATLVLSVRVTTCVRGRPTGFSTLADAAIF
jgi:hypothetical protein